ncbi:FecR family protein [Marinilabilia rubra]|uniref:Anti-sigma factor n=1 Tax=Marinilabilia rubra TaxID=2162893 RepID=A0A2U2B6J5_9BACT|nr:FecR domain-containing protein [Marinilabilia rubra]PWD98663.1 anti-sigma factor [Marinilabilia rubra]
MSKERVNIDWDLAARVLSGEADEIDRGLLDQWLNAKDANRREWEQICNSWDNGGEAIMASEIDTSAAWNRVKRFTLEDHAGHQYKSSNHRIGIISTIAASVIILLGVAWFVLLQNEDSSSSLIVSNSTREEMVLSDGSSITLNSGSTFSCKQPFSKEQRTVELNGEGYFEVEGNKEWPFVINTGEVSIRVTGTRFNVRAYPNIDVTEVSVIEGIVEVSPLGGSDLVRLAKGQTALFDKNDEQLIVKQSTDPNLLAWLTQKIRFDDESLSNVVETLERVYDVNIQLGNNELANEQLTARFSENSLDFVLEVVCTTFNLEAQREGETILLNRAPDNK